MPGIGSGEGPAGEDGRRPVQRITGCFLSGELLFDCYGTVGVRR
ncbi:hypothetical protein ACFOWE_20295 [Planomonospora corallina]|uniref:Uncharacterized protein n=1 Tax=Planomonospora corallina TaxID=1806052 RepID=A0ABV8I9S8_9ACTN